MTPQVQERVAEIRSQLDALQVWFASRTYGFLDNATTEHRRQWYDREREQDYLIHRLEVLTDA